MERRMTRSCGAMFLLLFRLPSLAMTDIIFSPPDFFMVATVRKDSTRRFDVPLPDARSGQVAETRRLTIEVTADGEISFNGDLSSPRSNWSNNSNRRGGAKANGRW